MSHKDAGRQPGPERRHVVGAGLAMTRLISSGTLLAVVAEATAAGLVYAAPSFAIGRRDRALYTSQAMELRRASAA